MTQHTFSNFEPAPTKGLFASGLLQRKCACGKHTGGATCAGCEEKNRHAQRNSAAAKNSHATHDAEAELGASVSPALAFTNSRFEHDFSRVRAHTPDEGAHASLTKNRPAGLDGDFGLDRRLFPEEAEEGEPVRMHGGVLPLREAAEMDACMRIMGPGAAEACRRIVLGEKPDVEPPCPEANQAAPLTGCIEPVVIADDDGTNPTTAPSFDAVQSIWNKCCINYTINATKTVNKRSFKVLDESPTNVPTAEERRLFREAGASNCIQVFVPHIFRQAGVTDRKISGGGGTYDGGRAHPKIVVIEGAVSEVVAHEVGHASGHAGHDEANTVMKATGAYNKPNSTNVSKGVCRRARKGPALTAGGADKSCCMDFTKKRRGR